MINIQKMSDSATKENQQRQKFFFLKQRTASEPKTKHVQRFGDERLVSVECGWDPEILSQSVQGNRDTRKRILLRLLPHVSGDL